MSVTILNSIEYLLTIILVKLSDNKDGQNEFPPVFRLAMFLAVGTEKMTPLKKYPSL